MDASVICLLSLKTWFRNTSVFWPLSMHVSFQSASKGKYIYLIFVILVCVFKYSLFYALRGNILCPRIQKYILRRPNWENWRSIISDSKNQKFKNIGILFILRCPLIRKYNYDPFLYWILWLLDIMPNYGY